MEFIPYLIEKYQTDAKDRDINYRDGYLRAIEDLNNYEKPKTNK